MTHSYNLFYYYKVNVLLAQFFPFYCGKSSCTRWKSTLLWWEFTLNCNLLEKCNHRSIFRYVKQTKNHVRWHFLYKIVKITHSTYKKKLKINKIFDFEMFYITKNVFFYDFYVWLCFNKMLLFILDSLTLKIDHFCLFY